MLRVMKITCRIGQGLCPLRVEDGGVPQVIPRWVATRVPDNDGSLWAPDVHFADASREWARCPPPHPPFSTSPLVLLQE